MPSRDETQAPDRRAVAIRLSPAARSAVEALAREEGRSLGGQAGALVRVALDARDGGAAPEVRPSLRGDHLVTLLARLDEGDHLRLAEAARADYRPLGLEAGALIAEALATLGHESAPSWLSETNLYA